MISASLKYKLCIHADYLYKNINKRPFKLNFIFYLKNHARKKIKSVISTIILVEKKF